MRSFLFIFIIFLVPTDISAVIWPCSNNSNCTSLSENATCSNGGTCVCPPGQVYSIYSLTCLEAVLFGDKCEESVQCSLMPTRAQCTEGICQCQKGYTYIQGQCRKLKRLGEKCTMSLDCWFGYNRQSVVCLEGNCTCASGYYERHSEICRQKSKESEPCAVHTDCETQNCTKLICIRNGAPENNKSVETIIRNESELFAYNKFYSQADTKKFGDKCAVIGEQCEGLNHSICIENMCFCQPGYYPHPTTKMCYAELGERGNSNTCEHEIISGLCVCERNFLSDDNLRKCRKSIPITAPCTADNQCSPYAAYCKIDKPRKCVCPLFSEYDNDLQLCIGKRGLGAPCEENKDCPTDNSLCSENKMCTCINKYLEVNGTCVAGIGADCLSNGDCKVENSLCFKQDGEINSTCICNSDYVHISDSCLKKAFQIGDNCTDSKQCEIMLAKCVGYSCLCAENQHYSHGICEFKKYIGQSCSRSVECFIPSNPTNIECRNSICSCKHPYQTDVYGTTCVKLKFGSSNSNHLLYATYVLLLPAITIAMSQLLKKNCI